MPHPSFGNKPYYGIKDVTEYFFGLCSIPEINHAAQLPPQSSEALIYIVKGAVTLEDSIRRTASYAFPLTPESQKEISDFINNLGAVIIKAGEMSPALKQDLKEKVDEALKKQPVACNEQAVARAKKAAEKQLFQEQVNTDILKVSLPDTLKKTYLGTLKCNLSQYSRLEGMLVEIQGSTSSSERAQAFKALDKLVTEGLGVSKESESYKTFTAAVKETKSHTHNSRIATIISNKLSSAKESFCDLLGLSQDSKEYKKFTNEHPEKERGLPSRTSLKPAEIRASLAERTALTPAVTERF